MKLKVKTVSFVEVKYLQAEVGARYWEDTTVNDIPDEDGYKIPCRVGDMWCPLIDVETGVIVNWGKGKTADVHYKSCDNNVFKLLDAEMKIIAEREGYVIDAMCPGGDWFGDYVIMKIDADGKISDWKETFPEFEYNEED